MIEKKRVKISKGENAVKTDMKKNVGFNCLPQIEEEKFPSLKNGKMKKKGRIDLWLRTRALVEPVMEEMSLHFNEECVNIKSNADTTWTLVVPALEEMSLHFNVSISSLVRMQHRSPDTGFAHAGRNVFAFQ